MLYADIPNCDADKPTICAVISFTTGKKTHITETTTHGYYTSVAKAKAKFQKVSDYAAANDADPKTPVLLDTGTEFAYIDKEGNECHILIHFAG
jgi:hypothetical protein